MSYNTEKIIVKNEDTEKEEDVKLFYSTITDNIGITCGEQEVSLTKDQFEALSCLMFRCFYTRDMLNEARMANDCGDYPYTVYSSHDEITWAKEVEED